MSVLYFFDLYIYKIQGEKAHPKAQKVHVMKITQRLPMTVNLYKGLNISLQNFSVGAFNVSFICFKYVSVWKSKASMQIKGYIDF